MDILPPTYQSLLGKGYIPPEYILEVDENFWNKKLSYEKDERYKLHIRRFLACVRGGAFQKEDCGMWVNVASEEGPYIARTIQEAQRGKNISVFFIHLGIKPLPRG